MVGARRGDNEDSEGSGIAVSASSNEQDNDEDDEEELQRMEQLAKGRQKREQVAGETFESSSDWKPPVHAKTPEQRNQIRAAVGNSFLFSSLQPENLDQVIDAFQGPIAVKSKEEVIKQGDIVAASDAGLYILTKGQLDVFKAGPGEAAPGTKVFAYDKVGQSFGELALLYNCPRAATVVAATSSVLWSIDRTTFNHCVKAAKVKLAAEIEAFLASVSILQSLTSTDRSKIADVIEVRSFEAGKHIIRQGEDGNEFFIVQSGQAYASVDGQRVKDYRAKDYFGELALMKRQPRKADVIADATPTKLLVLDGDSFKRLMGPLSTSLADRAKDYEATKAAAEEVAGECESEGGSEDDMDSEEERRFDQLARLNAENRRPSVAAEKQALSKDWQPPVYQKTLAQREQIRQALAKSMAFAALPPESLEQVINAFKGPNKAKKGDVIIRQGDTVQASDEGLFVIETGQLDVFKAKDGVAPPGAKVFTYDAVGQSFGELALLYSCPRAATVVSCGDSALWSINRDTFNRCVKGALMEMRERQGQFLVSVPILQGISSQDFDKLADVVQVRVFQAGEQVIRQGDEGREFFIVQSGRAHASVNRARVKEYVPGEYFGELALMTTAPRKADIFADVSPTHLLVLDGDSFKRLLGPLSQAMLERAKDYASTGIALAPAPIAPVGRSSAVSKQPEDATDSDQESEETNDSELLKLEAMASKRTQQRGQIFGGSCDVGADWRPPVFEKTRVQRAHIRKVVSSSFVFAALPPESLEQVVDAFQGPMKVKKTQEVIRQGALVSADDPGLFIVERGTLEVFKCEEGKPHPGIKVGSFERPGELFGELALLYDCPRSATVISQGEAILWFICRDTFKCLVQSAHQKARQMQEDFLASVDLFKGLTPQERAKVADVLKVRICNDGEEIIRCGDDGNEFFMLQEGHAVAFVKGVQVKSYSKSDYFGELALMRREPRKADVLAKSTPTRLLVLDGDSFRRLLGPLNTLMEEHAKQYQDSSAQAQAPTMRGSSKNSSGRVSDGSLQSGMVASLSHRLNHYFAESEDEDEDAEEDEEESIEDIGKEEMEKQLALVRERGMRLPVLAERWHPNFDWIPPKQRKTAEQKQRIRAALSRLFMFALLPSDGLQMVVGAFKGPMKVRQGEAVMRQGQHVAKEDPGVYILISGHLVAYKADHGEAYPGVLSQMYIKPGDVLGELALLHNAPRPATVIAMADSTLWWLDRETCRNCIQSTHCAVLQQRETNLETVSVLHGLLPSERARIAEIMYSRTYTKGDVISRGVRHGGDSHGREFFMVEEGKAYATEDQQRMQDFSLGDHFGELALIRGEQGPADIVAGASPTRCAVLRVSAFRALFGPLQAMMASRARQYTRGSLAVTRGRTGSIPDLRTSIRLTGTPFAMLTEERRQSLSATANGGVGNAPVAIWTSGSGAPSGIPAAGKSVRAGSMDAAEHQVPDTDWICTDPHCGFQNLQRVESCVNCGLHRGASLPAKKLAPPGLRMLHDAPTSSRQDAADIAADSLENATPHPIASPGVDLTSAPLAKADPAAKIARRASVSARLSLMGGAPLGVTPPTVAFVARYAQRLPEVGVVQGPFPLAPGERFLMKVISKGTFGEIGLGLAPLKRRPSASAGSGGVVSAMVGWAQNEVGFLGDHGRWYHSGRCPGKKVSPPWEVEDILECGLTTRGCAYFARNGEYVAEAEGFWPIAHAYPTVTMQSAGAQLAISFHDVAEKSLQGLGANSSGEQGFQPRKAWDLLTAFKRTAVAESKRQSGPGMSALERWLAACGCVSHAAPDRCSCIEVSR